MQKKIRTAFGKLLVAIREEADICQKTQAEALGVSQAFICQLEVGDRRVTDKIRKRITKHFKIDGDNLNKVIDAHNALYEEIKIFKELEKVLEKVKTVKNKVAFRRILENAITEM